MITALVQRRHSMLISSASAISYRVIQLLLFVHIPRKQVDTNSDVDINTFRAIGELQVEMFETKLNSHVDVSVHSVP